MFSTLRGGQDDFPGKRKKQPDEKGRANKGINEIGGRDFMKKYSLRAKRR